MDWLWLCTAIICLAIGYSFGYHTRDAHDKVATLRHKVEATIKKQPVEPSSKLVELPLSPAEQITRDHQELMEKLNPKA